VPMHEIAHQAEAINQIILCDLPDFDSLIGDHSAQVQRFFRASRCIDYGDLS